MGRPREFDVSEAVERAMTVFWDKGYEGASLPDLLCGMGIARGSLYKAFGDKKQLFMASLNCYRVQVVDPATQAITHGAQEAARDRLESFFAHVGTAVKAGDRRGCLLCNLAAGPACADPDISAAVTSMLGRITHAFDVVLAEIPAAPPLSDAERGQRAKGLTASYVGLQVLAKAGAGEALLIETARASMAAFCPQSAHAPA